MCERSGRSPRLDHEGPNRDRSWKRVGNQVALASFVPHPPAQPLTFMNIVRPAQRPSRSAPVRRPADRTRSRASRHPAARGAHRTFRHVRTPLRPVDRTRGPARRPARAPRSVPELPPEVRAVTDGSRPRPPRAPRGRRGGPRATPARPRGGGRHTTRSRSAAWPLTARRPIEARFAGREPRSASKRVRDLEARELGLRGERPAGARR